MPSPMIIPGVQVTALFEPEPVLPGAIGILGLVGVVDRGPITPTAVGSMAELTDVFGPATRFTMPEARAAFMNGVSEIVVARVPGDPDKKAELTIEDDDGDPVLTLRARAEGTWGNHLGVRVTQVKTASGKAVKYVNVDIDLGGIVVESFNGLVMDEESPNYLFDRINQGSRLVVAYDPGLRIGLPAGFGAQPFVTGAVRATETVAGTTATAIAPGREGNRIVVTVTPVGANDVEIEVKADGEDPTVHTPVAWSAGATLLTDALVTVTTAAAATKPASKVSARLKGGRDSDPALLLPEKKLLNAKLVVELIPANPALDDASVEMIEVGVPPKAVDIVVISKDGAELERLTGLVMDPDDSRYLVDVLRESKTLRARDLAERLNSSTLPKHLATPLTLSGGNAPTPEDYVEALRRLEQAEEVDLVIASTATQLTNDDAKLVQNAVVAHCTAMADKARTRIGLGSIFVSENDDLPEILSHADDVRSDHFILIAPANTEGAMAGLLGRLDYFRSPTFKTIASVDAPLVPYTDTELSKLITANVAVIAKRKGIGIIPVKGLLTSGRQINVQRTADVSVRRVKAIADRFIGLLNDDGTRNALRQQIIAMFLQMERDGAIVPSVDGTSPAFQAAVYSSPNDFTTGIVRIDIAMRPVRSIDYVYAQITVQN